jgi:hypothetical protein
LNTHRRAPARAAPTAHTHGAKLFKLFLLGSLRAIVGIRYPDRAAFCQALQTHSDLVSDALDDTFWHHTDAGYGRFLEGG